MYTISEDQLANYSHLTGWTSGGLSAGFFSLTTVISLVITILTLPSEHHDLLPYLKDACIGLTVFAFIAFLIALYNYTLKGSFLKKIKQTEIKQMDS